MRRSTVSSFLVLCLATPAFADCPDFRWSEGEEPPIVEYRAWENEASILIPSRDGGAPQGEQVTGGRLLIEFHPDWGRSESGRFWWPGQVTLNIAPPPFFAETYPGFRHTVAFGDGQMRRYPHPRLAAYAFRGPLQAPFWWTDHDDGHILDPDPDQPGTRALERFRAEGSVRIEQRAEAPGHRVGHMMSWAEFDYVQVEPLVERLWAHFETCAPGSGH